MIARETIFGNMNNIRTPMTIAHDANVTLLARPLTCAHIEDTCSTLDRDVTRTDTVKHKTCFTKKWNVGAHIAQPTKKNLHK